MFMRVLFVCSGNNQSFEIIPFIKEQGDSLGKEGVQVDYYPLVGKGLAGYIKAGLKLRRFLKEKHYELIHAHFTYCGWAALIGAGSRIPVVLSLMGSDANGTYKGNNKVVPGSRIAAFLTWLIQPFVKAIISKSPNIEQAVYQKRKSYIIPNGVNLEKFKPVPVAAAKRGLEGDSRKKILFLASTTKAGKNFPLVQAALQHVSNKAIELICPYPVAHQDIPMYLNQAAVLVFPSFMEGSPNVIKEAMACNCPIVSTDVGDVKWVLGQTQGCYLATFEPKDFAAKIEQAISFQQTHGRTNGRDRILELELDMETIAHRVVSVYKCVLFGFKGVYNAKARQLPAGLDQRHKAKQPKFFEN
jgi:teichuronic acid biosynthesis glycosyltransferase TuaC